jgi:hypothetical protein
MFQPQSAIQQRPFFSQIKSRQSNRPEKALASVLCNVCLRRTRALRHRYLFLIFELYLCGVTPIAIDGTFYHLRRINKPIDYITLVYK